MKIERIPEGFPSKARIREVFTEARRGLGLRGDETIADLPCGRIQVWWTLDDTLVDVDCGSIQIGEACPRVVDLILTTTHISDASGYNPETYNSWGFEAFLLLDSPDPRLAKLEYDFSRQRWHNPSDKQSRHQLHYTFGRLPTPVTNR